MPVPDMSKLLINAIDPVKAAVLLKGWTDMENEGLLDRNKNLESNCSLHDSLTAHSRDMQTPNFYRTYLHIVYDREKDTKNLESVGQPHRQKMTSIYIVFELY